MKQELRDIQLERDQVKWKPINRQKFLVARQTVKPRML